MERDHSESLQHCDYLFGAFGRQSHFADELPRLGNVKPSVAVLATTMHAKEQELLLKVIIATEVFLR